MRVLVTGAAGFIGHAVSMALMARGDSVLGVDNLNAYYDPALKRARIRACENERDGEWMFAELDLSDSDGLNALCAKQRVERVVHLGAQAGVRYSLENPQAYIQSNIVGHLNVLELARWHEIDHLVYASSSSVYGGNAKVPFAEDDRVDQPYSLYAATKKSDELLSESYSHLYRLPQSGLRFFTVYGPWGRPDMMPWIFTRKILAGDAIPVFNEGRMERDFTFIDDIVSGVIGVLDNPPPDDGSRKPGGSVSPHAIYNIGNNRSEPLLKVIDILAEACGREAKLEMLPMQAGDVPRTFANIDALKEAVGYQPTTPVEVGIPAFVEWFKTYHHLH